MTPGQERELLQTLGRIAVALEKMAKIKKVRPVALHPNELPVLPVTEAAEIHHDISRTMGRPNDLPSELDKREFEFDVVGEHLRLEGDPVQVAKFSAEDAKRWKDPKGGGR